MLVKIFILVSKFVSYYFHMNMQIKVSRMQNESKGRLMYENNVNSVCFYLTAVFFNRGYAEPQVSASGCQGFCRNRPKLPGTEFATTVPCSCNHTTVSQVYCRKIDTWIIA